MSSPSTPAATAGSAPAVATTAPVVAAPAAPAVTADTPTKPDVAKVMASLTPAQRLAVATGRINEIAPDAQPAESSPATPAETPAETATTESAATTTETTAPAETTAVETASTPTTETQPGGASPEPGEGGGDEGGKSSKRFRFTSEEDQAVAQIARARGVSLVEAARIYAGETAKPAAETATSAPAAQAVDPHITAFETRISEANERIRTLTEQRNTASEDLDHKRANALSDEIADAKMDLRAAETDKTNYQRQSQQQAQSTHESQVTASRDAAYEKFPVFAESESLQRYGLDAYVQRALNDPTRKTLFKDPNWPLKLATEFAEKQGIKPKAAGAAPATTTATTATPAPKPPSLGTKATPQQVTGSRMLTSAGGDKPPGTTQPLTREALLHRIRTDPEARRQAVRINTSQGAAR